MSNYIFPYTSRILRTKPTSFFEKNVIKPTTSQDAPNYFLAVIPLIKTNTINSTFSKKKKIIIPNKNAINLLEFRKK